MDHDVKSMENGQNLIIFAVLMVVMLALAGLVIDGGFSLVKRRQAQNAADAGALAGAAVLCQGGTSTAIEAQARDYAINKNNALSASVSLATKEITVTTTIPHQTFFMSLFGTSVVTTTATASAGCYAPCTGVGVMPVAWACHDPTMGGAACR
jgi:Flp pilus assembly protein TadG